MPTKKQTGKWIAAAVIIALLLCSAIFYAVMRNSSGKANTPGQERAVLELSAWLVDWQWESGLQDVQQLGNGLAALQLFAAYFDEEDRLYFTDQYIEALPSVQETAESIGITNVGLTIVNDRIMADGTSVQKDSDLVSRLVATESSRVRHIDEIMDTVLGNGFDGVEIDYEKVRAEDWDKLCMLYAELYERLQQSDKFLKIVLEPRAPLETLELPKGPVYVMMAYNLYGTHSGPGPKADIDMIRKLSRRMLELPVDRAIALSVGGFDWAETGKVTSVTEQRAIELAAQSQRTPQRDAASGSLHFEYMDEAGTKHTVWYADQDTISGWIDAVLEMGIGHVAIWRLGELGSGSLQYLNQ